MKRRPFVLLCAAVSLLSAYCHRVAGELGLEVATPQADGAPCNNGVECASFACTGGVCVAPAGGQIEIDHVCSDGDTCVGDAKCDQGLCVATAAACAADQTPCETGSDCCSLECTDHVCGFGGSCGANFDDCDTDSDCCSGHCSGDLTCTDGCLDSAEQCSSSSDCCSGVCNVEFGNTCD